MSVRAGWDWNRALGEMPGRWTQVAEEIVAFASWLNRGQCSRVHDLGCGVGRHTAYLASRGFDVTATDVSASAMAHTAERLRRAGLGAKLCRCNMLAWPFAAGAFDAVVAFNVVYHATRREVETVLGNIDFSLRDGGLLFMTLKSTRDSEYGQGRQLESTTFAPLAGIEKDVPHYYADETEARRLLARFDLVSLHHKVEPPVTGGDGRRRSHWVARARKRAGVLTSRPR